MQMTVQEVRVQRVSIVTTVSFDTVVARIDAAIGHPDMVAFRKSFSSAQNTDEMEQVVNPVTQPNDLMEFTRFDLGEVLRKENGGIGPRILRIVAGNPLIMKEMVKHVVDAGSYAPVTILIEERADDVASCMTGWLPILHRMGTAMLSRWRERWMKRSKEFCLKPRSSFRSTSLNSGQMPCSMFKLALAESSLNGHAHRPFFRHTR